MCGESIFVCWSCDFSIQSEEIEDDEDEEEDEPEQGFAQLVDKGQSSMSNWYFCVII